MTKSKSLLEKYRAFQTAQQARMLGLGQNHSRGYVLKPEDAEKGLNFISAEAHRYIVQRSKSWRVFVNRDRVLGNLISSQALCFNLFTDLSLGLSKKDPQAQRILQNMFPFLGIHQATGLYLERLPKIPGFKKVATSFDSVLFFKDARGLEALAGLEVKYLEGLDEKRVGRGNQWHRLAAEYGVFNARGLAAYPPKFGFNQIARNFLLALAYGRYPQKKVYSLTLGLAEDGETRDKVKQFKKMLKKPFGEMVRFVPLEEVVGQGLKISGGYREILKRFQTRYFAR